ncbi:MAG: YegP family protein [Fimbriimonadales bacterium]
MRYVIFKDRNGQYRWHLEAANNRIIACSGEGYHNKQDCRHSIYLTATSSNVPVHDTTAP